MGCAFDFPSLPPDCFFALKVLHVIPSLDPSQGGPSTVMPEIARALVAEGVTVDVACVDPAPEGYPPGQPFERLVDGYRVLVFPSSLSWLRLPLSFFTWLQKHAIDYDLIHVHGVLNAPCLAAEWTAVRSCVPLVVRPLGILNRWGMANRKALLKKIWFRLLEKPLLDQAAAMHFTSVDEAADVARLKIDAPSHVLPLGMDMRPFARSSENASFRSRHQLPATGRLILFLSRIHPKKGLELLFEAFAQLRKRVPETFLVIAGDGDAPYLAELKALAERLDLSAHLHWIGFLHDTERIEALAAADLFCLPSLSENFGIALLEAMASGLPCVSSPEVALAREPAAAGAVKVVPRDVTAWTEAMHRLLTDPAQARELGQAAIRASHDHYSIQKLGGRLSKLYGELLPLGPQRLQTPEPLFLSQITPVILTWNEEPNLERCLRPLQWAKTIIILDSGSQDRTAEIAARYPNVRFLTRPFDNHTAQWNHAIDQAPTDWVLALDADYVTSHAFAQELASLVPCAQTHSYEASFRYLVFGEPLRASLYPPRAVLFHRAHCRYVQDGHTQLLHVNGLTRQLKVPIDHDDRKPLTRWLLSQDKYACLEVDKMLNHPSSDLRVQDRLRQTGWLAVPATVVYTLFVRGLILDGWRGWYYTLQRMLAEMLLCLRLLERRLSPPEPPSPPPPTTDRTA